jgi:DNA-binding SARP family transcriptional activator
MFGRVAVLRGGEPLSVLSKALELLCYLVLHRERAHTRETLAGLLWPDAPPAQARKYLRQSLWQLQTNLAVSGGPGTVPMLDVSAARVRVHPEASWWCDVDVVERAHRLARDVPAGALSDRDAAAFEHAVALCQDDLLDTWSQDWCVRERDRLQLVHLDLLDRLTEHAVCRRLLRRGLAHGQRLLRLDPAREVTHRQLMRLYAACGDRTGALRQYGRCVQALAQEFDLPPAAETVELYRRIRDGSLGSTGADVPPELPGPREPLDERLDRIADAVVALRNDVGLLLALHRGNPEERGEAWETG